MSKSGILLTSINSFYNQEENRTKLINILDKSSGISLRNLEWFITNYAKKNNTSYTTKDGKYFTVHCAYKSSLDGYSKNYSTHFVVQKNLPMKFLVHLMKFKQPWHS